MENSSFMPDKRTESCTRSTQIITGRLFGKRNSHREEYSVESSGVLLPTKNTSTYPFLMCGKTQAIQAPPVASLPFESTTERPCGTQPLLPPTVAWTVPAVTRDSLDKQPLRKTPFSRAPWTDISVHTIHKRVKSFGTTIPTVISRP